MLGRARPTSLLDWGILASYLVALLLIVWAVLVVDWWSTAIRLIDPELGSGVPSASLTRDGQTLLSGYPGTAIALLLIVPCGWFLSYRNRIASVMLGLFGIGLTIVAGLLDPLVTGLVTTNAWIPAAIAWFFYFGALLTALSTQDPQLELEPRPDSSDG
ncbi:MAG: hypothetical protein HYX29_06660 [Solirubrobacterales bacterium]|nr:hypothetical protein [Solirubrobacterales bacterium]